jgi:site-specific recombinase XerC
LLDYDKLPARVARAPRPLPLSALRTLFWACADDPTTAGVRDAAILALLYGAGLWADEVVALDLADYAPHADTVHLRHDDAARCRVYVAPGGGAALAAWLAVRDAAPGPLFHGLAEVGDPAPHRLAPDAVRDLVQRRASEAGIGPLAPEDLHTAFIVDLFLAGVGLDTVRALTTRPAGAAAGAPLVYEAACREAVQRLRVPYRPHVGESM